MFPFLNGLAFMLGLLAGFPEGSNFSIHTAGGPPVVYGGAVTPGDGGGTMPGDGGGTMPGH